MTSYFWSGFPSLSGRPRVMYGRRHIGGATHLLRHPYRLGLLHYRLSYRSTLSNLNPDANLLLLLLLRIFHLLRLERPPRYYVRVVY